MFNPITIINLFKKTDKQKIRGILSLMIIFVLLLCFCKDDEFGGLLMLQKKLDNINNPHKDDFIEDYKINWYEFLFNRIYFVLITTSTTGYGDIIPKSNRLRIMTFIFLSFIFFISLS